MRDEEIEKRKVREKTIRHNATQVSKLVEFTDASQRGTMGSFGNLENVKRKGYRVPLSAFAIRFWSCQENVDASNLLSPILADIQRRNPNFYLPFFLAERNPTLLRNWKRESTFHEKKMYRDFQILCRFVATRLYDKTKHLPGGPLRVFVVIDPEDEEAKSTRQVYERGCTWGKEESFRRINVEIDAIIAAEQCSVEAAIGVYRDRLERDKKPDVSPRKIREARAFVRHENSNDAA